MRAYSLELRQRIVRAVQAGHPKAEVADLFGVDRRTINRYLRLDATGDLAPKPIQVVRVRSRQSSTSIWTSNCDSIQPRP